MVMAPRWARQKSLFFLNFDAGEDEVPAVGVEAGAVVAQFEEDFFHLEGGEDGLDQHGGL